jgi:hypothetical protein
MNRKWKFLIALIVCFVSSILLLGAFVFFGLENDHRTAIAEELFLNDEGGFDFELLEDRLNKKYSGYKLKELRAFVESHGGSCSSDDQCNLYLYSTICISSRAVITVDIDGSLKVESVLDAC